MDEDVAQVVAAGALRVRPHGLEHLVGGGVAVDVAEGLPALVVRLGEQLRHDRSLRDRGVAGVSVLLAVGRDQVGLGAPGGATLGRSVEGDLETAGAVPVAVGPRAPLAVEHVLGGVVDVGHDVDVEDALVRQRDQALVLRAHRAALLHGRVAERLGQLQPAAREVLDVLGGRRADRRDHHRERGELLEHAVGLARPLPPTDDAALRVRSVGGVAGLGQAYGVHRAEVRRDVDGDDRHLGRHAVEVVARRVPAQERVVVAHPEHPARAGDVGPGGEPLQLLDEVVDRLDRAVGRGEQVRTDGLRAETQQVAVAVEEAGEQRPPREVGAHGRLVGERLGTRARADVEDASVVPDGDRLGGRSVVVDGDDRAAEEDARSGVSHGTPVPGQDVGRILAPMDRSRIPSGRGQAGGVTVSAPSGVAS